MINIKSKNGKNIKVKLITNDIIEGEVIGYSKDDVVKVKELESGIEIFIPTKHIVKFSFSEVNEKSFIDERDGNEYKTVVVGNQIWMAQNLAYKPNSGYFDFDGNKEKINKYGLLYSKESVKDICPRGWHLPDLSEWRQLINFIEEKEVSNPIKRRWEILTSEKGITSRFNAEPSGIYDGSKLKSFGTFSFWWDNDSLRMQSELSEKFQKGGNYLVVRCVKNK